MTTDEHTYTCVLDTKIHEGARARTHTSARTCTKRGIARAQVVRYTDALSVVADTHTRSGTPATHIFHRAHTSHDIPDRTPSPSMRRASTRSRTQGSLEVGAAEGENLDDSVRTALHERVMYEDFEERLSTVLARRVRSFLKHMFSPPSTCRIQGLSVFSEFMHAGGDIMSV